MMKAMMKAMKYLGKPVRGFLRRFRDPPPVVSVLSLSGIIGRLGALKKGLSLAGQAALIERAFKARRLAAVALAINSPGGSPVQAALIAGRIRALADEKGVPVFAFAEDVAASGGYWLALAADEIYADENSIIGSIGVISAGFGFPGLLERIGVERRLHTAGARKGMLDPFLEEKSADVKRLKSLQADIHESFKDQVRERRAGKLKAPEKDLFSGEFWTGRRALELGLIDGLGDLRGIMRERFGERVKLRLVGGGRRLFRLPFATTDVPRGEPGEWTAGVLAAVEERLLWNRFGL
jgi:signal peptide peptidase SppA